MSVLKYNSVICEKNELLTLGVVQQHARYVAVSLSKAGWDWRNYDHWFMCSGFQERCMCDIVCLSLSCICCYY